VRKTHGHQFIPEKLGSLLKAYEVRRPPASEEIISKLDRAGELFRVLVVKTNMRIPYTSCFSNWTADIGMLRPRNGFGAHDVRGSLQRLQQSVDR